MFKTNQHYIAIINFGGQYSHLISKRIRSLGYATQILSPLTHTDSLKNAQGVVLSGGPQSVLAHDAIKYNPRLFELDVPLMGICYGHQLMAQHLGGTIEIEQSAEYGKTTLMITKNGRSCYPFDTVGESCLVWMSHTDRVTKAPPGFTVLAYSEGAPVAAMVKGNRISYQFHPEVTDTANGQRFFEGFLAMTGMAKNWDMQTYLKETIERCRQDIGSSQVLMFLSGGVDSTVASKLLSMALKEEQLINVFIDNGFMRAGEVNRVLKTYAEIGIDNVKLIKAAPRFYEALAGVCEPQQKRLIIGDVFADEHSRFVNDLADSSEVAPQRLMLGQGTLYPDVIESGDSENAAVIKYHHNRSGAIQRLIKQGLVVEPLRELYKDEVRQLGLAMGLPRHVVMRHPFPGPGLAINLLCSEGDSAELPDFSQFEQQAEQLIRGYGNYKCRLLPVRSVGVQGDRRTYAHPILIKGLHDWDSLEQASIRLTNSLPITNRAIYLLTEKYPQAPDELAGYQLHQAYCTPQRTHILQQADMLATQGLGDLLESIFQLLVILLPVHVAGQDQAEEGIVLRPVISEDVMTARFAPLPIATLNSIAEQILNSLPIHSVFFDISHKPPATFGWE